MPKTFEEWYAKWNDSPDEVKCLENAMRDAWNAATEAAKEIAKILSETAEGEICPECGSKMWPAWICSNSQCSNSPIE